MAGALGLAAALLASSAAHAQQWTPRLSTTPPTAEQISEARERYERGVRLYEVEGDVSGALIELKRAYDIAPNYRILFNIGQVARTARDYVTSLRAFEAYLAQGGSDVDAAKRAEVNSELEALRGLVANIQIEVDQPGATLTVDDIDVGKAPLANSVMVSSGRHRVSASFEGRSATRSVEVGGRERITVDLKIPAAAVVVPVAPVAPMPPPEPESRGPSPYVWIGWGTAAALAGGAAITGVLALSEKKDLEEANFVGDTPPEDLESDRSTGRTLAITSDVLTATAIVTAGVSLYFTIATMDDGGAPKKGTALPPPSRSVAIRRLELGPGRVAVEGSF